MSLLASYLAQDSHLPPYSAPRRSPLMESPSPRPGFWGQGVCSRSVPPEARWSAGVVSRGGLWVRVSGGQ